MRLWMIGAVAGYIGVSLLPVLVPAWVFLLPVILCLLLLHRHSPAAYFCAGLSVSLVAATLYGHSRLDSRLSSRCEGLPLSVEGVIVSLPKTSDLGQGRVRQRFEFQPEHFEPLHCTGPRRLLLSYYGQLKLQPGQRWRFSVKLKRPWGLANPGSFNMQSWYAQSGIDGTGTAREKHAVLLKASPGNRLNYNKWRQHISQRLGQLDTDERVRGILRALLVADKSGIDAQLWSLFQLYGINHLLAISGLHISIAAGVGYFFGIFLARLAAPVGAVGIAAVLPALMSLGCAFIYSALAGFALATVRALVMLACFVAASLFSRGTVSVNNLLIAAVLVLVFNPLAAVGSGFWLSFSAVACLLWLSAWRTQIRLPLRMLHTHSYMALAMVPLGAWWFGGVSMVATVANFILVPLVGLFVVPVALLGVAAYLAGTELEHYFWAVAVWPLEQLLPGAIGIAQQQQEFLYLHLSPSPGEVVLAIMALALLVVPLPWGIKLLIPVLALPIFLPDGQRTSDSPFIARMTVLDVGQGTAVVLQSAGNTLVYDTGGGDPNGSNMASMVILPFLRSRGVEALDTLVVSHADNDHSAGINTLIQSMPVGQLLVSGEVLATTALARQCRAGEAWRWPSGVSFQILSPAGSQGLSSNNGSCVLQVHIGGLGVLLPGDIDARREKDLLRYWRKSMHSTVLLAAHHGSLSSSSLSWLKFVQSKYAVFSSGYLNQFGHPHTKVSERYHTVGAHTFSTAIDGAVEIWFHRDGTIGVTSYRALMHPYWM